MTTQLADARRDIEQRGAELEQAKDYLESILTKMSSGVIVVDEWWNIVSVNASASLILKTDLAAQSFLILSDPSETRSESL